MLRWLLEEPQQEISPELYSKKRDIRRIGNLATAISTEEEKALQRQSCPDASRNPDLFRTHEESMKRHVTDLQSRIMNKVKSIKEAMATQDNTKEGGENAANATRTIPATKPYLTAVAAILQKAEGYKLTTNVTT